MLSLMFDVLQDRRSHYLNATNTYRRRVSKLSLKLEMRTDESDEQFGAKI